MWLSVAIKSERASSAGQANMEHSVNTTTQTQCMVHSDLAIMPRTQQPRPLAQAREERKQQVGPMEHSMDGQLHTNELRKQ